MVPKRSWAACGRVTGTHTLNPRKKSLAASWEEFKLILINENPYAAVPSRAKN
jgi:hypothetical protein